MILACPELSTDRPSSTCGPISGLIGLEGETTRGSCPTHSSGVSTMRSITRRNAALTPIAVFADVSTNRQPIRAAYAAASAVGTCRRCSYVVSDRVIRDGKDGGGARAHLVCLVAHNDLHRRFRDVLASLSEPPGERSERLAIRDVVNCDDGVEISRTTRLKSGMI